MVKSDFFTKWAFIEEMDCSLFKAAGDLATGHVSVLAGKTGNFISRHNATLRMQRLINFAHFIEMPCVES
jgi:hypothetical protein